MDALSVHSNLFADDYSGFKGFYCVANNIRCLLCMVAYDSSDAVVGFVLESIGLEFAQFFV